MKINIAIDGPSAAGKSTISDYIAKKLDYVHLDTGAMYRAVAYQAKKENISVEDEPKIVEMISRMQLNMTSDGKVILNGEDISGKIRTPEMSMGASNVSKLQGCRSALVKMQQEICKAGGYILDGRDIGTVVLKDAPVKLFLIASAEARANRRVLQDKEKGITEDYNVVLEDIKKRDYQDSHRANSPLKKAEDAIEIDTSNMNLEESENYVLKLIQEKL